MDRTCLPNRLKRVQNEIKYKILSPNIKTYEMKLLPVTDSFLLLFLGFLKRYLVRGVLKCPRHPFRFLHPTNFFILFNIR